MARTAARTKSPGDAEQRSDDILEQQPVLQQIADSPDDSPGRWQNMNGIPGNGKLPENQQDCDERDRAETDNQAFRPLSFLS